MNHRKPALCMALVLLAASCQTAPQPETSSDVTAIVGATVIDDRSDAPLENATLVIEGDAIRSLGAQGAVEVPTGARRIEAAGKTIIPGLFNLHGHVALSTAMERGLQHHTRENILRDVNAYLYYGVTHVISLGINGDAMQGFVEDQQAGRSAARASIQPVSGSPPREAGGLPTLKPFIGPPLPKRRTRWSARKRPRESG